MNYKDNYRNDADAAWLRNLSYTVHPKPARFFMSAGSDYGACLACGKAEADKTGRFQIAAGFPNTVLRARFTVWAKEARFLSLLLSANRGTKIFCNGELIHIFSVCSQVLVVRLKKGENTFWLDALGQEEAYEAQIRMEPADSAARFAAAAKENRTLIRHEFALYMEKRDISKREQIEFLLTRLDQRQYGKKAKIWMEMRDLDTAAACSRGGSASAGIPV